MRRFVYKVLSRFIFRGERKHIVSRFRLLLLEYYQSKTDEASLGLLLELDNLLYEQENKVSIKHKNGVHPKHQLMQYHNFFIDRIDSSDQVLDIGCGIGAVAFSIAKATRAEITAIDFELTQIETAKKLHPAENIEYICGAAPEGLPVKKYSVVVLSNVLEHIEHRVEFLRTVAMHTQAKRILIRVPMFNRDWRVPLKREMGIEHRLDPTHYTEYTEESFREEMKQAGLQIKHLSVQWGEIWSEVRTE